MKLAFEVLGMVPSWKQVSWVTEEVDAASGEVVEEEEDKAGSGTVAVVDLLVTTAAGLEEDVAGDETVVEADLLVTAAAGLEVVAAVVDVAAAAAVILKLEVDVTVTVVVTSLAVSR
jgi:hypothetical protein